MPFPLIPAVGVAVAVGGAALLVRAKKQSDAQAVCRSLQTQLDALAAVGGDANEVSRLRVQLAANACQGATGPTACMVVVSFMRTQFEDYKRTSYSDPVSRDNKRNSILSQAGPLLQCMRSALDAATTREQVQAVLDDVNHALADSLDRVNCMASEGTGCGRFGVNEEAGEVRAWKEIIALTAPLGASLDSINARIWHNDPTRTYDAFAHAAASGVANGLPFPAPQPSRTVQRGRTYGSITYPATQLDTDYGGLRLAAETKLAMVSPRIAAAMLPISTVRRDLIDPAFLSSFRIGGS